MNTPLDNAEYQYFIFHSSTNQVSSGWEYREDARDALADLPIDLQATGRVLTRRGVNNALKAAVADDEVVIDATLTTTTTAAPVTVTVVPYHCTELAYQCCNCSDDPEWKNWERGSPAIRRNRLDLLGLAHRGDRKRWGSSSVREWSGWDRRDR